MADQGDHVTCANALRIFRVDLQNWRATAQRDVGKHAVGYATSDSRLRGFSGVQSVTRTTGRLLRTPWHQFGH